MASLFDDLLHSFQVPFMIATLALVGTHESIATPQAPPLTAQQITAEAELPSQGPNGRPLPLAAVWSTGTNSGGFTPSYQLDLVAAGHHILPSFFFPTAEMAVSDKRWTDYYEPALRRAAALGLPITLVGTQWESVLSLNPQFANLPPSRNPNVVRNDGRIDRQLSPFGPPDLWRTAGEGWTRTPMMASLQKWYPHPPLLLFLSNNEPRRMKWMNIHDDVRFERRFVGGAHDDNFKRQSVGDGWIERYRALHAGMRDGLQNAGWNRVRFIGFDAFGTSEIGRSDRWLESSLYTRTRFDPWPFAWDGCSVAFYVYNWNATTDFTVQSPEIEAMNWVFMQRETYSNNRDFWFEISTWDGFEPTLPTDKRAYYRKLGQQFDPQRYQGMVQFGMWLLRPRVVREYRSWKDTVSEDGPYLDAVVASVDRVYQSAILTSFWRSGELVPNRESEHPYQKRIPPEVASSERWFLLDTNANPPRPWKLDTRLAVFALALKHGPVGSQQWLVYAFAPVGPASQVSITLPDFGAITANISVGGVFYLVDEKTRRVSSVTLAHQ